MEARLPRPEQLSATALRNAVIRYRDVLRVHQEELNDLNVYPVPDGDSGTNLRLTLDSVVEELDGAADMLAVCRAISKGALRGARGNSGVILSQILHGIAKVLAGSDAVGGDDLARALRKGTDAAYDAVSAPKEGTILTVVREAAEASESVLQEHPEATFADVLERAAEAAREALARTPEMLPELREAGVVDSGGKGATLLLEALLAEAEGRPVPGPETFRRPEALDDYSGRRRFSPKYEVTCPPFKT